MGMCYIQPEVGNNTHNYNSTLLYRRSFLPTHLAQRLRQSAVTSSFAQTLFLHCFGGLRRVSE